MTLHAYYFYQGDPCRVRTGLPLMVQDGGIPWRSTLSSLPHPLMKGHITQSYRCQLLSSSVMKNLEKHTLLPSCFLSCPRKSPKANLQLTAETRLKKAQHTRRSHMCPRWASIIDRAPQSPLLASLPASFCLQTFTSCLLAQNANKSHGGHFLVAIETVIIISNCT